MEYEYVALAWRTNNSGADEEWAEDYDRLAADGWRDLFRASFEPKRNGGACIMRRAHQPTKAELQEAIDTVMKEFRAVTMPSPANPPRWRVDAYDLTTIINRYLYPLETKKED